MKRIISAVLVCVLLLGCVFALASCGAPNKDYKKAAEKLEKKGFKVEVVDGDAAKAMGMTAAITATKGEGEDAQGINIAYYEKQEDADKAYKALEESLKAMEELAEKAGKKLDMKIGQKGTMVWMGSKAAIKAAK